MAERKNTSGILVVRARKAMITPPGILGWSNLIEPDDKFGEPEFKGTIHWTPEQVAKMVEDTETYAIEPHFEDLCKEAKKPLTRPSASEWVSDKMKEAKEGARQQLPGMQFKQKADWKDKDGIIHRRTMGCWDISNNVLDLPSLGLGMGSTVQFVVTPGLFANALIKVPQPTFKLVGVRVLKLVQYLGSQQNLEEVSEDDLKTLESDFQADDLSAYTAKGKAQGERQQARDQDDADLPF